MLVRIENKNGKKAILWQNKLRAFSGIAQGRCYIRANNKHTEFDTSILSFNDGDFVEIDDYIKTSTTTNANTKSTTEHGAKKQRNPKTKYCVSHYLDKHDKRKYGVIMQTLKEYEQKIIDLNKQKAKFYEIAQNNFLSEQNKMQQQQKQNEIEKIKQLAKRYGLKVQFA